MVLTKFTPDTQITPDTPPPPEEVRAASIQTLPDAKAGQYVSQTFYSMQRPFILPLWGTRESELWLRWYDRLETNWLWQGARSGIAKKYSAIPYKITATTPAYESAIPYFQALFQQADFGQGWFDFAEKGVRDFLRQDNGWWFEVIAPGDPLAEPTGAITGIAYLDSYNCYPTGDPDYPLRYFDTYTGLHLMHRSRVRHVVDSPDGDAHNPGYGESALRRAISIAMRENLITRYIQGRLDDNPPPGVVITNLHEGERQRAVERYTREQNADRKPFWGNQFWLHAKDAADKPTLEVLSFSQAPEKFDFKVYTELDVDAIAHAIGVDRQEFWQLSGGNIGSAGQSEVLAQKAKGKTFGNLLAKTEWIFNTLLPEELTFEFDFADPEADKEAADSATQWGAFAASVKDKLTDEEYRQLLANKVEAVRDVITVNGVLQPFAAPALPGIGTPPGSVPSAPGGLTAESNTPLPPETVNGLAKLGQKDVADIRAAFTADFTDMLKAASNDDLSRRRAGIIQRDLLAKYGRQLYKQALVDSGIEDDLSADDFSIINNLITENSGYVTSFLDTLFSEGLSDAVITSKADMWFNKSLSPFITAGLMTADKNGLYEFVGQDGNESCPDCQRLKGQVHRLWEWEAHAYNPLGNSSKLKCGGYRCEHTLEKRTGRSKGKW